MEPSPHAAFYRRPPVYRSSLFACLVGVALALLAGCQPGSKGTPQSEIPPVPVSKPVEREVTEYVEYTGQTNAKDSVVIQPRVTGLLKKMPFAEGSDVKEGAVLFEIDPRPYEAQLKAAQASVDQNKAGLTY